MSAATRRQYPQSKRGGLLLLFTSLEFLLTFLPGTLAVYFLLPKKARNYWLLLVSLFFYTWGAPKFAVFLVGSIVFNYGMALLIDKIPAGRLRKALLAAAVLGNLSILFVFKYMNFVTSVLRGWFPVLAGIIPQTDFRLPIGISFFTFQALSYVVDVYRGTVAVQKNPAYVGLYISFFPQLIAGPIVRYTTIAEDIENRTITFDGFSRGVMRFLYGFNRKMLLANVLAKAADAAFAASDLSVAMAWLGSICYTLQIYFDFSGYSEMAIGMGRMFGFRFLENFNYPYISKTVTEFWRRWHISLGSWFRDYVYFPLGGSRVKTKGRLVFNLAVVWLATGIWHGANWTFLLWGCLYGLIIIAEKLLNLPKRLPAHRVAAAAYQILTMLAVVVGWVLFRADNLSAAGNYLMTMFGLNGAALTDSLAAFYFREYLVPLTAGIVCSTPLFRWLHEKAAARGPVWENGYELCDGLVQLLLFAVGLSCLVMNAHNPFIYFNF